MLCLTTAAHAAEERRILWGDDPAMSKGVAYSGVIAAHRYVRRLVELGQLRPGRTLALADRRL